MVSVCPLHDDLDTVLRAESAQCEAVGDEIVRQ